MGFVNLFWFYGAASALMLALLALIPGRAHFRKQPNQVDDSGQPLLIS